MTKSCLVFATAVVCATLIAVIGYPTLATAVVANEWLHPVYHMCSEDRFTVNSSYAANLDTLFYRLRNASSLALYAANDSSTSPHIDSEANGHAYGFFQCRGDLNHSGCATCVSSVVESAKSICPNSIRGRVMVNECILRYSNISSFYTPLNPSMTQRASWCRNTTTTEPNSILPQDLTQVLEQVATSAPVNNELFAVAEVKGSVYALAQCFGYLNSTTCRTCLSSFQADVENICSTPNRGGQVQYDSCFSRYEYYNFYYVPAPTPVPVPAAPSPSPSPSPPPPASTPAGNSSKSGLIVGVVLAAIFILLLFSVGLFRLIRFSKGGESGDENDVSAFLQSAALFSYSELKAATLNFAQENKLGQGGFGSVYKGKNLREWEEVAIKKLSLTSRQGKKQFLNEVSSITSVRHRNLVRLLGCCVEGKEKLLVYEYFPNKSLDLHLFNVNSLEQNLVLDWETRFGIILGTARGLAYLHHDSHDRIIHRDIKPGNILLGYDLTPKIADFGLAKLITDDDKTHVTTQVVGTYGYMPPEYAMSGQLTEKVDVFSFGMLMLEVVSGRKNSNTNLSLDKQYLLAWAWRAFREGRKTEVVDEKLGGRFSVGEAIRVMHVAFLCTQLEPNLRPTMSHVAQLLAGQLDILEEPTTPAYINSLQSSESSSSSSSYGHVVTSQSRSSVALTHLDINSTYASSTISDIDAR